MSTFYYSFFLFPRTLIYALTLPGLGFICLQWMRQHYNWNGVLDLNFENNPIIQGAIWFLVLDLCHYLAHLAMHKIPGLWRFHKLHHAATEFTILTGNRVAISEMVFNQLVVLIGVKILLGLPRPEVFFVVLLVRRVIDMLQHSDLPWHFGPLELIIVSPRFHRMHHSNHKADYDSNYGNIFTFWDYAFHTVAHRYRADPTIADTVKLGLETKLETRRYNRWYFGLINETLPEYLFQFVRFVKKRRHN